MTVPSSTRAAVNEAAVNERASRPGIVLATLLLGQFMAVLDTSIVNVAAPTVGTDLGASGAGLQLVVSGYLISYAVLLITGARWGDRIGHGRAFRTGLAMFTLSSLACGMAPGTPALVTFRFLQGVGAAIMMPQVMSLIQRTFSGAARARALSLYGAVISCGIVVGQVAGGLLVSANLFGLSWRPVFLLNVPIGAVLLWLAARGLPARGGDSSRRMDLPGVAALSAAVALLVVPLVLGQELGWPGWCWVSLAGSVFVLAGFAAVERGVGRRGGSPLVPAKVLTVPRLLPAAVVMFLAMATYAGYLFTMALHVQSGLGRSAAQTGLMFAPAAVGFAVTGLTWRRTPIAWHTPMIPAGLLIGGLGYASLSPILSGGGTGGWLEIDLLITGSALGLAFSPLLTVALSRVLPANAADASGLLVTLVQLGQLIGVATFGTLYLSERHLPGVAGSAHALSVTALWLGVGTLVAAAVALLLLRRRQPAAT